MDYVDGIDAGRLLTQRYPAGMPVCLVAEIVSAVAEALDYSHRQGLLHRDIKPANIMVTNPGDDDDRRILLRDFGIARSTEDISGLTATNMTVGTVAYAAHEQLTGEEIDGRADQYALAATAYQLLTGSQLFPHSNPPVVISCHLNASPPAVSQLRTDLWPASIRSWRKHYPRTPPTAMRGARTSPGPGRPGPGHSPSPHHQHPRPRPRCYATLPLNQRHRHRRPRQRHSTQGRGADG